MMKARRRVSRLDEKESEQANFREMFQAGLRTTNAKEVGQCDPWRPFDLTFCEAVLETMSSSQRRRCLPHVSLHCEDEVRQSFIEPPKVSWVVKQRT